MSNNYHQALKANRERLEFIRKEFKSRIASLEKSISVEEREKTILMEAVAILGDYERLMAMEMAGK